LASAKEDAMITQVMGLFATAFFMLSGPIALSQTDNPQPIYTYVSQFQVPRANWAQFNADTEKNADPVFERLMTDGTIVSWGDFETVVHTNDGMTHGSWWQAASLAGIMRVLDELRKAGPWPSQIAATKHEDLLMHTTVVFASPHPATTGYLRVYATHCQPGKGGDYVALIQKYFQTAVGEQNKKSVVTYWGMDEVYMPTRDSSMRYLVSTYPSGEALDKWAAAQSAVLEKMSPEDRKAFQEGLASTTVLDSPRSFHLLARITHHAQK
jgi:hypothetical protein